MYITTTLTNQYSDSPLHSDSQFKLDFDFQIFKDKSLQSKMSSNKMTQDDKARIQSSQVCSSRWVSASSTNNHNSKQAGKTCPPAALQPAPSPGRIVTLMPATRVLVKLAAAGMVERKAVGVRGVLGKSRSEGGLSLEVQRGLGVWGHGSVNDC